MRLRSATLALTGPDRRTRLRSRRQVAAGKQRRRQRRCFITAARSTSSLPLLEAFSLAPSVLRRQRRAGEHCRTLPYFKLAHVCRQVSPRFAAEKSRSRSRPLPATARPSHTDSAQTHRSGRLQDDLIDGGQADFQRRAVQRPSEPGGRHQGWRGQRQYAQTEPHGTAAAFVATTRHRGEIGRQGCSVSTDATSAPF